MDCQSWERQKNLDGGYLTVLTSSDVQRQVGMSMQLLTLLGNFKRLNYIITLDKKRNIYTNHHRKAQCLDFDEQPVDVIKQEFHPKTVGIKRGIPFTSGMGAGQMMVIVNNLMTLYIISGYTHVTVLAQFKETRKTKVHKDLLANLIEDAKQHNARDMGAVFQGTLNGVRWPLDPDTVPLCALYVPKHSLTCVEFCTIFRSTTTNQTDRNEEEYKN
ncbi:unnamed protein product [Caenorhabditis nigoni]